MVARTMGKTPFSEAGQGTDPVAGEGQDEQAGPVADAGRGTHVSSERRADR